MQKTSKPRLLTLATIAILPSFLKRPLYRLFFRYKIGKRVRIGVSIIDAGDCTIDDDVSIGHFNVVTRVQKLTTSPTPGTPNSWRSITQSCKVFKSFTDLVVLCSV